MSNKKTYLVTIPIGGHAVVEVEANSEEEAIQLALEKAGPDDLETWDFLPKVNEGNVCHFPSPWEIEAVEQ